MAEYFFDEFEPHAHAINISDVNELRNQSRLRRNRILVRRPYQQTFKVLVLSLSFTVVVASVIALASYLAIERRARVPNDDVNLPPNIYNNFASPSPSILYTTMPNSRFPTFSSMPATDRPDTSTPEMPDDQELEPSISIPVPTRAPVIPVSPTNSPLSVSIRPTTTAISSPVAVVPTRTKTDSPNVPSQSEPTTTPNAVSENSGCIDKDGCGSPTLVPSVRNVQPPIPTKPLTRAPTKATMPIFIPPTPSKRITAPPTSFPTDGLKDTECKDFGSCQIISNFPYLRDFLCFDEELGIADDCAKSCGLCGNVTVPGLECVDDRSAFFFVNDYWGHQSCKWLSTKAALRADLCQPEHDAYYHCPRLCGLCGACQDDLRAAIFISYTVGYKTCAWLAEQPTYQSRLCQPHEFGYKSCKETCGRCAVLEYGQLP